MFGPFLAHASLAVAPLRIARGIQNKVLEAMAMEKIAVVSPQAMAGISARSGTGIDRCQRTRATSSAGLLHCCRSGADPDYRRGCTEIVCWKDYSWEKSLGRIDRLLIAAADNLSDEEIQAYLQNYSRFAGGVMWHEYSNAARN